MKAAIASNDTRVYIYQGKPVQIMLVLPDSDLVYIQYIEPAFFNRSFKLMNPKEKWVDRSELTAS